MVKRHLRGSTDGWLRCLASAMLGVASLIAVAAFEALPAQSPNAQASSAGSGQAKAPVVASDPSEVAQPAPRPFHEVEYTIRNLGETAVIAHGVSIVATYSDGTKRIGAQHSDGLFEYHGVARSVGRMIPPHGSTRASTLLDRKEGVTIESLHVEVIWAELADGSLYGDLARAESTFQRREEEYRLAQHVLAALEAGKAAGGGRRGLHVALEHLKSTDAKTDQAATTRLERRNIERVLGRLEADPALAEVYLDSHIQHRKQRLDIYERHLRRK
jgi:hypothetical protein